MVRPRKNEQRKETSSSSSQGEPGSKKRVASSARNFGKQLKRGLSPGVAAQYERLLCNPARFLYG